MRRLLPLLLSCLLVALAPTARANVVVVMQTVELGSIEIELFDEMAPLTVENFLFYVDFDLYSVSFLHRSVPDFVIQGGGFTYNGGIVEIVSNPPTVLNEPGLSNLRGTIAMARAEGQVDSATTQWFINIGDNTFLDTVDEGFTAFGDVVSGMASADAINDLPRVNIGGALNELPVVNWSGGGLSTANLVWLVTVARQTTPQCGDVNADASLDDLDVDRLRAHLADPVGLPLTQAEADRCSVIGTDTDCNIADTGVLRRRLAGRKPIRAQICPAAI